LKILTQEFKAHLIGAKSKPSYGNTASLLRNSNAWWLELLLQIQLQARSLQFTSSERSHLHSWRGKTELGQRFDGSSLFIMGEL